MDKRINAANVITVLRILFSIIMVRLPVFSTGFYCCYFAAGFTDMIDGTVARKQGTQSQFGAQLDTAADVVLVAAAAYKLLPVLMLPVWVWIWVGLIALIKLGSIVFGFVHYRRFIAVHTKANKITGLALFVLPITIRIIEPKYSVIVVCIVALLAAVQEGYYIRKNCIE